MGLNDQFRNCIYTQVFLFVPEILLTVPNTKEVYWVWFWKQLNRICFQKADRPLNLGCCKLFTQKSKSGGGFKNTGQKTNPKTHTVIY